MLHPILVVCSLAAVSLAALLYATMGHGGAKPQDAGMLVGAARSPEQLTVRHQAEMQRTQTTLRSLGHAPGAIDGTMDNETSAALRAFQHRHGLKITGRLNPETRAALALGDRVDKRPSR